MSFLIEVNEVSNSQKTNITPVQKLYGYYFINSIEGKSVGSTVVLEGRNVLDVRQVSDDISVLTQISTRGYVDKLISVTVKGVDGSISGAPYIKLIKLSSVVEVYKDSKDENDSILRTRTNDRKEDTYYTVDETLSEISLLAPTNYKRYKEWRGLITQSGTDNPTATVTINELGGTITFTRFIPGLYTGNLTGAFTTGKTYFEPSPLTIKSGTGGWAQMQPYVLSEDSFGLNIYSLISGSSGNYVTENQEDGIAFNIPLGIRVYD